MDSRSSSKLALIFVFSIFTLQSYVIPNVALHVGLSLGGGLDLGKRCSRTCESKNCNVAPFLKYGRYCGLLYSGCPGEEPCDELDACCLRHDNCIGAKNNDYLSESCNQDLLDCVHSFQKSKAPSFRGNTCDTKDVVNVIEEVMEAAIATGKILDDYLSESCNQNLLNCVHSFQQSRAPSFRGNTCDTKYVIKIIEDVMEAAISVGKVFGKP